MSIEIQQKAINAYYSGTKRTRRVSSTLTPEYIYNIILGTNTCCYCSAYMKTKHKQVDHIKPLAKKGEHAEENLQIICGLCNSIKGAMSHKQMKNLSKTPNFRRTCTNDFDDLYDPYFFDYTGIQNGSPWGNWNPQNEIKNPIVVAKPSKKELVWKGYDRVKDRKISLKVPER